MQFAAQLTVVVIDSAFVVLMATCVVNPIWATWPLANISARFFVERTGSTCTHRLRFALKPESIRTETVYVLPSLIEHYPSKSVLTVNSPNITTYASHVRFAFLSRY